MKKSIVSIMIILMTIALLMTTANATFEASSNIKEDLSNVKVGDTITLTIKTNEKIVAANFTYSYDKSILELDGSGTSNLSVAEKNGKIACIYADMSGKGIDQFDVKFKVLKETNGTEAAILAFEEGKFRAVDKDESYTGEDLSGLNSIGFEVKKVENSESTNSKQQTGNQVGEKDKTTTKTTTLPKTGKETGLVIAGITVLAIVAIIFGKKSKELSKIFSSLSVFVIAVVLVTSLNNNVYAASEVIVEIIPNVNSKVIDPAPTQFGKGILSNGEKYIGILVDKSESDRKVETLELTEVPQGILAVLNDKKELTSGDGQDLVKTGYYLRKEDGEYKIVLYGDANGDGIICDTDDIMVIINDYLGKKNANELEKLAANLDARDDLLDTDDLMQMINMYLGKLDKDLVVTNINVVGKWKYSCAMKDGKEVTLVDIFGSSAMGSSGYLNFKEDGTFVNSFPGATSIELENEGKYSLNGNNIKLQFTNQNVNLEYNSKENTISYPYGEYTLILKRFLDDDKEYLDANWEYSIGTDNTITLAKYIGEDTDVTIKENYNINNIQYKTLMGTTRTYDYYGPFTNNKTIEKITFESTNVFDTDVSYMFFNCEKLKTVIGFGGNIISMNNTFSGCTSLLNANDKNSSYYIEGAEINIPDTVKSMNYAFYNCESIEYLPYISSNSKLESALAAFKGCSGASSGTIYLNSTVTNMNEMFYGCNNLGYYAGKGFTIYSNLEPDKAIIKGAFDYCGYQVHGGSAYGSQQREIVVLNTTDINDQKYLFLKNELDGATNCEITIRCESYG